VGLGISTILAFSLFQATVIAAPRVEVVQSVPIETTLDVAGIPHTQEVWVQMIQSARSTLDLEEFYINGEAGQSLDPVLAAIRDAAARGVQVRLLIDSKFYSTYPNDPDGLAQVPNIQVKTIDYSKVGGIQHSKYIVVDRTQVFVGSANLDWLALTHIHEVGLHITDSSIATSLDSVFEKDWKAGKAINAGLSLMSSMLSFNLNSSITDFFDSRADYQLVASPPSTNPSGISDSLSAVIQLLNQAKHSIRVQVYQYATKVYGSSKHWYKLDQALKKAAARGVHVQLLVDAVSLKTGKKDLRDLASLENVEVRVVRIPEWSGGHIDYARLVHSKYLVVDDAKAWVGTENWEQSYFTGSRNVGIITQASGTVDQLARIFHQVWASDYLSAP
jgi:phosphatidylserine/phosphatidylglycerophosphate/cardiolipin synthase-like enzyme